MGYWCDHCGGKAAASVEMGEAGGLEHRCLKCRNLLRVDADVLPPTSAADERIVDRLVAKAQRSGAAKPLRSDLGGPINVVALARKRLRDVERELRKLRALEAERDELRRLLQAAKAPRGAVVTLRKPA